MEWSNKMGSRSRRAWLLIVHAGTVHVFRGVTIPGTVAVAHDRYVKQGKWSHTIYSLRLADGATAIAGKEGWDTGRFVEGLAAAVPGRPEPASSWSGLANQLQVTDEEAQRFLREWRPKAAAAVDEAERAIASL